MALELVGLLYLSQELLESRGAVAATHEFTKLQHDLESSVRDLIMRMNAGLTNLAEFVRGHLSVLEMEAEYREDPVTFTRSAARDPGLRQVLDSLHGHSPRDLRKLAVEKFVLTSASLPRGDQTERVLTRAETVRAAIARNYWDQVERSQRLTRLSRRGAALVATGVGLQLANLMFL